MKRPYFGRTAEEAAIDQQPSEELRKRCKQLLAANTHLLQRLEDMPVMRRTVGTQTDHAATDNT